MYQKRSGFTSVQTVGLIFLAIMLSAISIDFGLYYAMQDHLHTAADAGALAAAQRLWSSTASTAAAVQADATTSAQSVVNSNVTGYSLSSNDVVYGYVDPATKMADRSNFTYGAPSSVASNYSTTGGYNAVQVTVRQDGTNSSGTIPTAIGNFFGVGTMKTQASSIGMLDNNIGTVTGGLRPINGCQAQFDQAMAAIKAGQSPPHFRIYGDHYESESPAGSGNWVATAGCTPNASGNWGFADFSNCTSGTVGASTIGDWFTSGYPGTISISALGGCYSSKPGNFLSSNQVQTPLDTLIANQTVVLIPLVPPNGFTGGGGSNEVIHPSGFSGFVFTNYVGNGAASGRYIEGYYTKTSCIQGATCTGNASAAGGGIVNIHLVGHN